MWKRKQIKKTARLIPFIGRSKKVGLPPGTLTRHEDAPAREIGIKLIDYKESEFSERTLSGIHEALPFKEIPTVTWVDVDCLDADMLERFGKDFNIHPLTLEDILHTDQRAKVDEFENYVYIVLRMFLYDEETRDVSSEQVSLIIGPRYVVSFQERPKDVLDPVRERIRKGRARIRKMGADYLAYAIIDSVVDHYFVVLERLGERLEELEDEAYLDPTPELLSTIHKMKRDMLYLRKSIWPLREVAQSLSREENDIVTPETQVFLRDLYDHTIRVVETIETYRDILNGMMDIYLSSVSNRMNEVMKVLTIIATIFIPLSFFAGVYGMNFEHMPELSMKWGYYVWWGGVAGLAFLMLALFKRKGWL